MIMPALDPSTIWHARGGMDRNIDTLHLILLRYCAYQGSFEDTPNPKSQFRR